jgi:MFS family permease
MKTLRLFCYALIYCGNYFLFFSFANFGNQLSLFYRVDLASIALLLSLYGVVALFSYIPSGYLADKRSPMKDIRLSLIINIVILLLFILTSNHILMIILIVAYAVSSVLLFYSQWLKLVYLSNDHDIKKSFTIVFSFIAIIYAVIGLASNQILLVFDGNFRYVYVVIVVFNIVSLISFYLIEEGKSVHLSSYNNKIKFVEVKVVVYKSEVIIIGVISFLLYLFQLSLVPLNQYFSHIYNVSNYWTSFIAVVRTSVIVVASSIFTMCVSRKVTKTSSIIFLYILVLIVFVFILNISHYLFAPLILPLSLVLIITFFITGGRNIFYSILNETNIQNKHIGSALGIVTLFTHLADTFANTFYYNIITSGNVIINRNFNALFIIQLLIVLFVLVLVIILRSKITRNKNVV